MKTIGRIIEIIVIPADAAQVAGQRCIAAIATTDPDESGKFWVTAFMPPGDPMIEMFSMFGGSALVRRVQLSAALEGTEWRFPGGEP